MLTILHIYEKKSRLFYRDMEKSRVWLQAFPQMIWFILYRKTQPLKKRLGDYAGLSCGGQVLPGETGSLFHPQESIGVLDGTTGIRGISIFQRILTTLS